MSFRDLPLQATYQAHEDRLGSFYVPVLREAVHYDRLVGYWRSSSLVVAAAGLPYFLKNALAHGGRMRVVTGAELTDQDVRAIYEGEPIDDVVARRLLAEPEIAGDFIAEERLRIVAWMVREGLLEMRVGVPLGPDDMPLPPTEADRLFHTKYGVLTDVGGDRVVFEGSVNESARGWRHNHEGFTVYQSWRPEIWNLYGQPWVDEFERHWGQPDPVAGWLVLDFPDAVREQLLARLPPSRDWVPPLRDPGEDLSRHRLQLANLRAAPTQEGGTGVAFATLPIELWPHQHSIGAQTVEAWPRSYLLADEVGLGKTIEAGVILRELLMSGKATRALLLVPASVQRQWQEELWEKFCIDVPSYEGGKFINYTRDELKTVVGANPWSAFPVVLASSHLARRRARRAEVLGAGPWDLVLVDEAHHARLRGIGGAQGANQLLQLLRSMKEAGLWRALILASATPMQMNTHEIFELLGLLGLPSSWALGVDGFESYYRQLAEPDAKARDWALIRRMLTDHLGSEGVFPNRVVRDRVRRELAGPAQIRVERFHEFTLSGPQVAALAREEQDLLDAWLRANTPVRDRVFRTTRDALREYQRQGILAADKTIPRRHVSDRMISFDTKAEVDLYRRIEDYISRYYEAYNRDRETKPLGFIMTVYRRRLTSSLHAVHKSLQRRLKGLREQATGDELLDDDDRYALENSVSFDLDDLTSEVAQRYAEEMAELESFLADVELAIPLDTKVRVLTEDLRQSFLDGHRTVVVFTQYTDTLEMLRDEIKGTYGSQVACYTGKGGSVWDAKTHSWKTTSKKEVKELFRAGEDVRILLGTDAMSEGLNLQTCGRLINYDMPWNFMRVEQRIGRLDRIEGQPDVYVTNYFYKDTVEEQVYSGIQEDARWFEEVVGPAQPVLNRVEVVIQDLAMRSSGKARDQALRMELDEVRSAIADAKRRAISLETLEGDSIQVDLGYAAQPAMTLDRIEEILTENPLTSDRLHVHPDFARSYFVEAQGAKHPMTFDRAVYDENPEIEFMTYGHPIFEALLDEALEVVR